MVITNTKVDLATAEELNKLFMEILIAPAYDEDALQLLKSKKNRILLKRNAVELPQIMFKTILNGVLVQDKDLSTEVAAQFTTVTEKAPTADEVSALEFALKVCKHTKSNTIVLAKENQLLASGTRADFPCRRIAPGDRQGESIRFRPEWCGNGFGCILPICGLR